MSLEMKGKELYLLFKLQKRTFAFSIYDVREIIKPVPLTYVAGVPAIVEGLINLRGKIVPVLNIAGKLGLSGQPSGKRGNILIVNGKGEELLGLLVDEICGVSTLGVDQKEPAGTPSHVNPVFTRFTMQDKEVIGIINLERLLFTHAERSSSHASA